MFIMRIIILLKQEQMHTNPIILHKIFLIDSDMHIMQRPHSCVNLGNMRRCTLFLSIGININKNLHKL